MFYVNSAYEAFRKSPYAGPVVTIAIGIATTAASAAAASKTDTRTEMESHHGSPQAVAAAIGVIGGTAMAICGAVWGIKNACQAAFPAYGATAPSRPAEGGGPYAAMS